MKKSRKFKESPDIKTEFKTKKQMSKNKKRKLNHMDSKPPKYKLKYIQEEE